ncbi:MAG: palindromic element RPE4 domain-containing protein [Rickettsia sp.]
MFCFRCHSRESGNPVFFYFFLDTVVKPRYDTERNTHSQ